MQLVKYYTIAIAIDIDIDIDIFNTLLINKDVYIVALQCLWFHIKQDILFYSITFDQYC